jgi:hypothetical protein
MVPVPEEHVEAVMQFVLRAVAQAALQDWDTDSLTKLWGESDEATRSLLSFTARSSAAGTEIEMPDLARQMQLTPREAIAIVNELSTYARNESLVTLVNMRVTSERMPNGRTVEKRLVSTAPEVADVIREVERAELVDASPPGASD